MSIVVSMKIRQHGKMGLSCRFDAFERYAPIRPPIVLTVLNGFNYVVISILRIPVYYDINKYKKPCLPMVVPTEVLKCTSCFLFLFWVRVFSCIVDCWWFCCAERESVL